MSDELVIRHCAPTLASIKTANLFSCIFTDRQEMLKHVRNLNLRLKKKGTAGAAALVQREPRIDLCIPPGQTFKRPAG